MSAISAASRGASVTVCEQLACPGAKLLASGGGRCNFTNTLPPRDFARGFGVKSRFVGHALRVMPPAKLREFLEKLGCPSFATDGFRVHPASNRSKDVLDALLNECRRLNVEISCNTRVDGLVFDQNRAAGVRTGGKEIHAGAVIISAGGRARPRLGGTGGGYPLAEQAGHAIVEPAPALVPLITAETWPGECAGITLPSARVAVSGSENICSVGELLFTHDGLSGPAALDISGAVAELLRSGGQVGLSVMPVRDCSANEWMDFFRAHAAPGRKRIAGIAGIRMPGKLAGILCGLAGIPGGAPVSQVSRRGLERLAGLLAGAPLTVTATAGFDKAMLTRGGVSLREINPATMESGLVKSLFFTGEVVDIDGPSGGYNLQWAFSSGRLAGLNAAAQN